MRYVIITLCLALALTATTFQVMATPQDADGIAYCDNSGAPDKKDQPHHCACQQAIADDCDSKPVVNMPGCKTNCDPDKCKCHPDKCS